MVQCSAVQWNAVRCYSVHFNIVWCSTVQCSAVQCSTVQYSTVQYSTVQYSTVQHTILQYGTKVKCITVKHTYIDTHSRDPVMHSMVKLQDVLCKHTSSSIYYNKLSSKNTGKCRTVQLRNIRCRIKHKLSGSQRNRNTVLQYSQMTTKNKVHQYKFMK